MNKKHTLEIEPIQFNTLEEVAVRFATIMAELQARATSSGEFEEEEKGLGWKEEINDQASYMEDGYIKGMVGNTSIDLNWVK